MVGYGEKLIQLGVQGLTVHPRQDERHATRQDTRDLALLTKQHSHVEFNVEGYPGDQFLQLIEETKPDQCTLVPDAPDQLTSDHGWNLTEHFAWVTDLAQQLKTMGVRSSLFIDPDVAQIKLAAETGVDRIELYTESFANSFAAGNHAAMLAQYAEAAGLAQALGLGVNAGHDLDLQNLAEFLTIPGILEVSIGHALTVESLEFGVAEVIKRYLKICTP